VQSVENELKTISNALESMDSKTLPEIKDRAKKVQAELTAHLEQMKV
jgi:hypothetical protein